MFNIWQNAHTLRAYVPPNPIDHRCMEYCYTKYVSHIAECIYTYGICTPQLTIDVWNTTAQNKFNI